jgi:peptidyl-prolyl cis-trans isomerase A (cyclophilin A)
MRFFRKATGFLDPQCVCGGWVAGAFPAITPACSAILLALAWDPADAALEVDFITNRGTITAIMDYQKAPKAVANLIGLASGSRSYVDPVTGAVLRSPFLDGAAFFKVVNNAGTKTIETGSPLDVEGVGPGYTFADEFDPTLTHVPYVLSMSNSGPNTNGCCFAFTGNVTMSSRDGLHTVFGRVTSTASRSVIDSILAAGPGTSQVRSVTVRRTDAAALAFDADAAGLPLVRAVDSPLLVQPGVSVRWAGSQPALSVLQSHESRDLVNWTPHFRNMVGLDDAVPASPLLVDDAAFSSRFYQFSLVEYPGCKGRSTMAGRTLTIESPGIGSIIYQFNAAGNGGTYSNIVFPGDPPFYSGTFTVAASQAPVLEPYSFRILLYSNGLGGSPYNLIRGGYDAVSVGKVTGRHVTLFSSASQSPVFEDAGTFELTRP